MKFKQLFKKQKTKAIHLVGLEITTRKWKKKALILAVLVFAATSIIPGPNVPGFFLAKLILGRLG